MAAKYVYGLVRGSDEFPLDMLRYDTCFPATEYWSGRAQATTEAVRCVVVARRTDGGYAAHFNTERWASFQWDVVYASTELHKVEEKARNLDAETEKPQANL